MERQPHLKNKQTSAEKDLEKRLKILNFLKENLQSFLKEKLNGIDNRELIRVIQLYEKEILSDRCVDIESDIMDDLRKI